MTLLDNVLLGTYSRTKTGLLAGALRLNQAEEASARYEALRQLERVGLGDRDSVVREALDLLACARALPM
mgnify:CR=1 FL=1